MKIAITGGTGFVGRHLARALVQAGHSVVLIARGTDARDLPIRALESITFLAIGTSSIEQLHAAFAGCDAVAHFAGINRQVGEQTYEHVHVEGTRNVVEAARAAGVTRILLLSFLRARPDCHSAYHESKWAAEEIVRGSGLQYTIIKAGMIYGRGDHMLDHLSHSLLTSPIFATVGFQETAIRPVAVEDVVLIFEAALLRDQLINQTVAVVGPQQMVLSDAVRKVARVLGRRVLIVPAPLFILRLLAFVFEKTMAIPLISRAQVFMLAEPMTEVEPACACLPSELLPTTAFTDQEIRKRLPAPEPFGLKDLRIR